MSKTEGLTKRTILCLGGEASKIDSDHDTVSVGWHSTGERACDGGTGVGIEVCVRERCLERRAWSIALHYSISELTGKPRI